MTPQERAFLCEVVPEHRLDLGRGGVGTPPAPAQQAGSKPDSPALEWKPVPDSIACPAGTVGLAGSAIYFIDGYALSADGNEGAISGGWQAAPLAGQGGTCSFRRENGVWRLVYCQDSWIS
jgi:hypothetical protein